VANQLTCVSSFSLRAGRRKTLVGMLLFGGLACVAIMFVHVDGKSEIYHFDFCAFVVKRLLRLDAYLKYHLRSNIICVDLKTS